MNTVEKEILPLLRHMRDEYGLVGVKGEFEAEGARLEELLRLKEISSAAGLEMIVKIGGCEAITDMRQARSAGATQIIAPMIESAFAARNDDFFRIYGLVNQICQEDFEYSVKDIEQYFKLNGIILPVQAGAFWSI